LYIYNSLQCILRTCSTSNLIANIYFLFIRGLTRSTFFPYTTLFRSIAKWLLPSTTWKKEAPCRGFLRCNAFMRCSRWEKRRIKRSEEHTSELQSLTNLVCRLLLEKKKENTPHSNTTLEHVK